MHIDRNCYWWINMIQLLNNFLVFGFLWLKVNILKAYYTKQADTPHLSTLNLPLRCYQWNKSDKTACSGSLSYKFWFFNTITLYMSVRIYRSIVWPTLDNGWSLDLYVSPAVISMLFAQRYPYKITPTFAYGKWVIVPLQI